MGGQAFFFGGGGAGGDLLFGLVRVNLLCICEIIYYNKQRADTNLTKFMIL